MVPEDPCSRSRQGGLRLEILQNDWEGNNKDFHEYYIFWPYTPEEYMAMPGLAKLKGKLVVK